MRNHLGGLVRRLWERVFSLLPATPEYRKADASAATLYAPALVVSAAFVIYAVAGALPGAQHAAAGHGDGIATPATHELLREAGIWASLALICLLCITFASYKNLTWLYGRGQSPRQFGRSVVAIFALTNTPSVVLQLLFAAVAAVTPGIGEYSSRNPTSGGAYGAEVVVSASAGFSEEVLVVAVPVLIILTMRPRLGRVGLSVLITLLAAMRLAYHAEYGIDLITIAPWAVLMIAVFVRARALLAMMCAHTAYDVMVNSADMLLGRIGPWGVSALCVGLCASAWWAVLRWTRMGAQSGPGASLASEPAAV